MSVRHGYVHTPINHDLHLTQTDYSWATTGAQLGSGPWHFQNYYPAFTYEGNGVFTFAKVAGVDFIYQQIVFKIHYTGDSFINQHIGIDLEMLAGNFSLWTSTPYYYCNYLISASWTSPAYPIIDHTQPFNGYTGLNIGDGTHNIYGGVDLPEAVFCPANTGVLDHWKRYNLDRGDLNLSALAASGGVLNPNPPVGMTWLKKQDYWFVFTIRYAVMNSASVKFQIHRIYRQSPDPDPGSSPPAFTQTDIFPTDKGW